MIFTAGKAIYRVLSQQNIQLTDDSTPHDYAKAAQIIKGTNLTVVEGMLQFINCIL